MTFLNGGMASTRYRSRLDLVAGFDSSGQLDLQDIAFATATKKGAQTHLRFTEAASNPSGTLTVTDGVYTANIELLINYTAGQFVADQRWARRHAHRLHVGDAERGTPSNAIAAAVTS